MRQLESRFGRVATDAQAAQHDTPSGVNGVALDGRQARSGHRRLLKWRRRAWRLRRNLGKSKTRPFDPAGRCRTLRRGLDRRPTDRTHTATSHHSLRNPPQDQCGDRCHRCKRGGLDKYALVCLIRPPRAWPSPWGFSAGGIWQRRSRVRAARYDLTFDTPPARSGPR